uniref:Cysteine rich secreted protein n=1 Tax=Riptortus pedestris TaxID=329032 RepID=R4WCN8_RIPPE|nr:cysteine rich secreted protein [Riptortus pedestris]
MSKFQVLILFLSIAGLALAGIDKRGWEQCSKNHWCMRGYYCCDSYLPRSCCSRPNMPHLTANRPIRRSVYIPHQLELADGKLGDSDFHL